MTLPPNSNLTARLLYVLESLLGAGSPNSISDVHAALEAIHGPEGDRVSLPLLLDSLTRGGLADLKSISDAIGLLRGTGARTVQSLLSEAYFAEFAVQLMVDLSQMREDIALLKAAIGASPFESLELSSVRGLLYALLQAQNVGLYGPVPGGVNDATSGTDYVQMGRRYAVFSTVPDPLTIDASGINVTAPSWEGWRVYIQTRDPHPWISGDIESPNTWLSLTGSGVRDFSVEAQYTIRAYLRREVLNPLCVELPTATRLGSQRVIFPDEPPTFLRVYDWAIMVPTEASWAGWTVTNLSAGVTLNLSFGTDPMGYSLGTYELIGAGASITLGTEAGNVLWTSATGPALVRVCPPYGSPS